LLQLLKTWEKEMKKSLLYLILVLFVFTPIFLSAQEAPDNTSKIASVMINVTTEVVADKGTITLDWLPEESTTRYEVYRRNNGTNYWGTIRATLDKDATSYVDEQVEIGKLYEYKVHRYYLAMARYNNEVQALKFVGAGYVCAGINAPAIEDQGRILLLVDKTMYASIKSNVDILMEDLVLDGWTVEIKQAERSEGFDKDKVQATKDLIMESAMISTSQLKAVFLIGRIPVPYSGFIFPDGHTNHVGAWPCDAYYGSLNETYWSDTQTFEYSDTEELKTSANREEQVNVAGDGKFDRSTLGKNIDLYVGRIDFFNMPLFHDSEESPMTEIELINQYLVKDHKYRIGEMEMENRGLIDENFSQKSYPETFGASAYRNFATLLGNENIEDADWFTTLSTESYLWAYGCGGGSFTSCGGIGNTQDFVDNQVNSVFTLTFGSYFGDWDVANNFLRAPLASAPSSLISAWVARPPWYFHHMGMGYPVGYSAQLSMNNQTDYLSVLINLQGTQYTIYAAGLNGAHTELLGDPAIRMYMNAVAMPSNLSLVHTKEVRVTVAWEAPEIDEEVWFNVYRSANEFGPYVRINDEPLTGTSYEDNQEIDGIFYYMVRSLQPVTTNSGIIDMLSRGIRSNIDIPVGVDDFVLVDELEVYPNPAVSETNLKIMMGQASDVRVRITDISGNTIKEFNHSGLAAGEHFISWDLNDRMGNRIANGVYLLKVRLNTKTLTKKIIVIR
jgi:flagellar hook capping protein FlgD